MWHPVHTCKTTADASGFLNTLDIWLKKPHVINRRLCGSNILCQETVIVSPLLCELLPAEIRQNGTALKTDENLHAFLKELKDCKLKTKRAETCAVPPSSDDYITENVHAKCDKNSALAPENAFHNEVELHIIIRDLLPRQIKRFCVLREVIIINSAAITATYIPLSNIPSDGCTTDGENSLLNVLNDAPSYKMQMHPELSSITLSVDRLESVVHKNSLGCSEVWLKETLLTKLSRWAGEELLNTEVSSLKLVSVEEYNRVYQDLKEKYAANIIETWSETTDPQKFVFEDIAITAYLLVLWTSERRLKGLTKKQTFVDLGCGNGLLVHLLSSEGYLGKGIDIRKRKIWDNYGEGTVLEEIPIAPSDSNLYPEYDWLIGNHSDELTPWIPAIAARSSYNCSYFVLPCCPWDFVGKFGSRKSGMSQYQSYLEYIEDLGGEMGFEVERDALRIPSTKRVCFIGRKRSYLKEDADTMDSKRSMFISQRSNSTQNAKVSKLCDNSGDVTDKAQWANDFEARDKVEKVRNCVTVDSEIKRKIINSIFNAILSAEDAEYITKANGAEWNKGGTLNLSEAVQLIDQETLMHLKSECGGLQTLLKNASNVFNLRDGKIHMRVIGDETIKKKESKRKKRKLTKQADYTETTKTKMCFFNDHHPEGCFVDSKDCRFAHGVDELVTR